MSQLYKLKLPKVPNAAFKQQKLPSTPKIPTQASPTTFPALSPGFTTNDSFEQRYQQWGRGSRAEFITWDFLTNRLHLTEPDQFSFIPGGITEKSSRFYVGDLLWRIRGDTVVENKASFRIERTKLENSGYKVVDLHAQDLQLGSSDRVLNDASRGIEQTHSLGGD